MQEEKVTERCAAPQKRITKANFKAAGEARRRLLAGIACVSLGLASCGGGIEGTPTPVSKSGISVADIDEVATALGAASLDTVTLQAALKMNASSITSESLIDRFIIKYKTGTNERGSSTAVEAKLRRLVSAFPAKALHSRRLALGADLINIERKLNAKEAKAFMRAIASDQNVEYIEPDVGVQGGLIPNDPDYGQQWGLASVGGIHSEGAWNITRGAGVVVALVDNGITRHSDLDANILPGMNLLASHRGETNGFNPGITTEMCGVVWHGTNVMGPLAAVTNNGIGMAGTAGEAKVVPVRVLDACANGVMSDMADGITWAAGGSLPGVPVNPYPAKIVNVSISGFGSCSKTLQAAIDDATARGAAVVTIAGNNEADAVKYLPGNCRNVIVVGNVTANGMRGYLSNYGPNVDIAAPGYAVWTTYNNGTSQPGPESYGYAQGTSIAAPFVSGVIALMQSVAPKPLTSAETRTLLTQSAHRFGPETPDFPLGSGVVDATSAVVAARSGQIPAAADFKCTQNPVLMQVTCMDLSTSRGASSIKSWDWNFGAGDPDFTRAETVNPYFNYDFPGTYQIALKVTDSTGAVSKVTVPFVVQPPTVLNITGRDSAMKFSAAFHEMTYFSVTVPSGSKSLTLTLSPGAFGEIATLYLRAGTPSLLHPDCESVMVKGAAATCTISNPTPGIYYAIQSADTNLNGASIQYALK